MHRKRRRKNKKVRLFLIPLVVFFVIIFSIFIIPSALARYTSTKSLSTTLSISKPVFTITLDEQSPTTHGTLTIYEKYGVGFYLNQSATTQMTTATNGITVPLKDGYDFQGYYTQTNGGGIQYIDENGKLTSSANSSNFSSNGTLYAYWVESVVRAENLSYSNVDLDPNCGDSQCTIDILAGIFN